jgi:hypothetical protein
MESIERLAQPIPAPEDRTASVTFRTWRDVLLESAMRIGMTIIDGIVRTQRGRNTPPATRVCCRFFGKRPLCPKMG